MANDVFNKFWGRLNAKLPPIIDPNIPEIPTILERLQVFYLKVKI